MGSLLLSTLGFLLPIALYHTERVQSHNMEPVHAARIALHSFIVVLGLVVAVVGTYNSVRKVLG